MNTSFRLLCSFIIAACFFFGCQAGGEPSSEKSGQTAGQAKSASAAPSAASKKFRKSVGRVNDFALILNDEARAALNEGINAYESKTNREAVVVTVKSIAPYTNIHKYAKALGNEWGVGKAGMDNGVVLLYCTGCQAVTIATGKGSETSLSDDTCQKIISDTMIPQFRQQKAAQALIDGLDAIFKAWPR